MAWASGLLVVGLLGGMAFASGPVEVVGYDEFAALEARVAVLEAEVFSSSTSTTVVPETTTTAAPTTTTTEVTTTTQAPTTTVPETITTSEAPSSTLPVTAGWPTSPPGPSGTLTVHSGDFTTSSAGQVVQNLEIRGRFIVKHANVTLRNSRVLYTTNYGLDNRDNHPGLVVEDTEFDGQNLPTNATRGAGLSYTNGVTLRRVYAHNMSQGFISYGNTLIEDSILIVDRPISDSAHREAVLLRGSDHTVVRSKLICDVPSGCSAALAIYGYPSPVHDVLVQDNLFGGQAGYCVYGGSTHDQTDTANVRILDNGFDPSYVAPFDICGRAGNITGFDASDPGNLSEGNYYWPSLEPI
jgi:hypothetical protein